MSSEMQLAHAAGLPVRHDGNGQPVQYMTAPPPILPPTGMKKIHRLLRGRYGWVVGLGLLLGTACAVIGFISKQPMYQSYGRIYISPTIPSAHGSIDEMLPGYSTFLHSQVAWIESREMIEQAMKRPKWQVHDRPRDDAAIDDFYNNLEVEEIPSTSLIKIAFSDPDALAAKDGATAMCEAYQDFYENQDPLLFTHKINQLDQQRSRIGNELQQLRSELSDMAKTYGTDDLSGFLSDQMQQLAHLGAQLDDAEREYKEAQAALAAAETNSPVTRQADGSAEALSEGQIASFGDAEMKNLLSRRIEIEHALKELNLDGYGESHPKVQAANNQLEAINSTISAYVDNFNHHYRIGNGANGLVAVNLQQDAEQKRLHVQILTSQREKQDALCREVGQKMQVIQEVQGNIAAKQHDLDVVNSDFDQLNNQKALMQGQMEIISAPSVPTEPAHDKRLQFAILGFLGGGLLPAFLTVMMGLLDARLRFSDETHHEFHGVPLLGILPNLPDLLTDPDQAATAAHCVHQIRTILQITGQSLNRHVFTVTSGSSGDGKTSLTLALGLSFAASGSRTLMIDGDLVGGGLTARLAIAAEHGVLEAMAARDFLPLVHSTDVADLSLLPIGQAMGGYTGSIAPASVRRLVDEARKKFDVIIIDTGPILGSIEASPMAAAADGVIICVSRGQQRNLVDRAILHLQSIGAKLSGVVFNRAQAKDFDRSNSRMSLHAMGGGNGNGSRIGPVVTAVASSVRSGMGHGNK